ncbi:hypothetical protein NESM_000673700 [Novymonas esmeraldas]|uniref:Uncharacterized protein n=1 Tax=Novymonas esmeraldas TaxID=1808958 RepID=A0AAW0EUS4_9TRYP
MSGKAQVAHIPGGAVGDERDAPWRGDDTLVAVSAVEWVAKNVFLVAVPSYRRKLSCELTAVDVPRGTAKVLTRAMAAVLQQVNSAMRVYLRQDFYSDFPLQGFGDIIFSAESQGDRVVELHWCSLQETLVRAGVACVVRPSVVRCESLLQTEMRACAEGEAGTWLWQLQRREQSPLFCAARRCVVEDVMRGDVYRVAWAPLTAEEAEKSCATAPLPPILILDATVCEAPSTAKGFTAMRWAQMSVLHRELLVHVHGVFPSDADVAYNTQLETYEHLAHARCTAQIVVAEAETSEGDTTDLGEALVAHGYGWVRRVADAGVPRASNFLHLCHRVGLSASASAAAAHGSSESGAGPTETPPSLAVALHLSPTTADSLLRFNGAWWRDAMVRSAARRGAAARWCDSDGGTGVTRALWAAVLWCGDVHRDVADEPRAYMHRPLRTLFPLTGLATSRQRLSGYVEGAAVVRCEAGARAFLQVEVTTAATAAEWKALRRRAGFTEACAVQFSPAPGDAFFPSSVNVVVSATGLGDDTETRLRVSCQHYVADTFLLSQHTPTKDWEVRESSEYVALLSVKGTGNKATVFVLDVVVEGRDDNVVTWTQRCCDRAVYSLAADTRAEAYGSGRDRDDDRDGDGEALRKVAAARRLAAPVQLLSKLSLFFELDAAALDRDGSAALLPRLRRAVSHLLYEDVVVLPAGVAEVNGVRGLVGDLLFPSEAVPRATTRPLRHRATTVFRRSLLCEIGRTWWRSSTASAWPMRSTLPDDVQLGFVVAMEAVAREEEMARQRCYEEVQWVCELLHQELRNCFVDYRGEAPSTLVVAPTTSSSQRALRCVCLVAGEAVLWHDSAAGAAPRLELSRDLLPPTVPLSLFAIRPRGLIYTAAAQKKTVVTRSTKAMPTAPVQEEAYDQLDWIFMRLRLPRLPNILHADWERLPLSLRNTERAVCDAIARNAISTCEVPGMLYTTERIFSLLLSYLAILHTMSTSPARARAESAAVPLTDSALANVYATLQHCAAPVLDSPPPPMRFSATLFVLPRFKNNSDERGVQHSRALFLGSRDNLVADVFEVPSADNASPEIATFPPHSDVVRRCVAALGVESLVQRCPGTDGGATCESLDCGGDPEKMHPLGRSGLAWGAATDGSTPVLYHPLPRIAVLAAPLVERDELTPEALGRLELERDIFANVAAGTDGAAAAMTRRTVCLRYRCLTRFSEKDPYKGLSYGRVSSRDMYGTLLKNRARGSEVTAYMSLLLRRRGETAAAQKGDNDDNDSDSDGSACAFPDGELTVYGLPSEPLYVHYRARADLRFTFSTLCSPLQAELLRIEEAHGSSDTARAAMDKVETQLLSLYAGAAAGFVRRIYERVRREQRSSESVDQVSLAVELQPRDADTDAYVSIQVFPVQVSDAETTEHVLDYTSIWPQPRNSHLNPHRTFSLHGSRYGRLALAELRITFDASTGTFGAKWNEVYENTTVVVA